jgi:hypothetical protein
MKSAEATKVMRIRVTSGLMVTLGDVCDPVDERIVMSVDCQDRSQ